MAETSNDVQEVSANEVKRTPQRCSKCHQFKLEWNTKKQKHKCTENDICTSLETCPTSWKKGMYYYNNNF